MRRTVGVVAFVSEACLLREHHKAVGETTRDEELAEVFKKAAKEPYYEGILGVTEEELVSSDFIGDPHSCIVDLPLIDVVGGDMAKVVAWYDNEWGFSNRMCDTAIAMGKHIKK